MKLTINGIAEEIELSKKTISELLVAKKVEMPEMVSIEFNGNFLRKDEYETTIVQDGDEIEFLYFMGGGQTIPAILKCKK